MEGKERKEKMRVMTMIIALMKTIFMTEQAIQKRSMDKDVNKMSCSLQKHYMPNGANQEVLLASLIEYN